MGEGPENLSKQDWMTIAYSPKAVGQKAGPVYESYLFPLENVTTDLKFHFDCPIYFFKGIAEKGRQVTESFIHEPQTLAQGT